MSTERNYRQEVLEQVQEMVESGVQRPSISWYAFVSLESVLGLVGKRLVDGSKIEDIAK